nr:formin-like protein 14 [Arachis hypogaea]
MPPSTTSRVSNTPLTQPPPPPPSNQIYSYTPPPQPIASSCHNHPDLLHKYMSYTPFSLCPSDSDLARRISYPPWLAPPPPPPLLLPNRAAQTLIPSPSRPFPFFTLRFLCFNPTSDYECGCTIQRGGGAEGACATSRAAAVVAAGVRRSGGPCAVRVCREPVDSGDNDGVLAV